MFKLDLEKAEEPEIKLPTSVGSLKKQDSSRNDYAKALVKEESEKVDLKLNIQKTKIMGLSCHICPRYYHLTFVRKTPRDWRSLIEGLPHTMFSA